MVIRKVFSFLPSQLGSKSITRLLIFFYPYNGFWGYTGFKMSVCPPSARSLVCAITSPCVAYLYTFMSRCVACKIKVITLKVNLTNQTFNDRLCPGAITSLCNFQFSTSLEMRHQEELIIP